MPDALRMANLTDPQALELAHGIILIEAICGHSAGDLARFVVGRLTPVLTIQYERRTLEQIREIAEKVMGWPCVSFGNTRLCPDEMQVSFNPFTNATHTEMVMDRMRELGWNLEIHIGDVCSAQFWGFSRMPKCCADNWRIATCLAALEAINARCA